MPYAAGRSTGERLHRGGDARAGDRARDSDPRRISDRSDPIRARYASGSSTSKIADLRVQRIDVRLVLRGHGGQPFRRGSRCERRLDDGVGVARHAGC